MTFKKPFSEPKNSGKGFTILELTAVLVILSALSSITIPNINKWIKLSRIDEAKGALNIAAANCLQRLRAGKVLSNEEVVGTELSNEKLNTIGYKISNSKNICSDFQIEPSNSSENILYTFGFRINDDGDVTKTATPSSNDSSLNSCKKWAGTNCGVSAAQQAEWDRLAALATAKKNCNDAFYVWLNETPPDGGSGQNTRWDSDSDSCTLETWAFEGNVVGGETGYNSALERKLGQECSRKIKLQYTDTKASNPTDDSGNPSAITIEECGAKEFWFVNGVDEGSKDAYLAKVAANKETKCINDREEVRQRSGKNTYIGKYGPFDGPGKCGEVVWMCDGKQVTSEKAYKTETVCGRSEAESACGQPRFEHCKLVSWWGWWECEAWSKCMGLL
jgi:prepilin-type N-terminal cleavage/methylation domain-containing protein